MGYYKLGADASYPCIVTTSAAALGGGWSYGDGVPNELGRYGIQTWNQKFPAYRIPVPQQCEIPAPRSNAPPVPAPSPPTPQPSVSNPPGGAAGAQNIWGTGGNATGPITGDRDNCAPSTSQRTDSAERKFTTEDHLKSPRTGGFLGYRNGAEYIGAAVEPMQTGLAEYTIPPQIATDRDGNLIVANPGVGPGGIAFAPGNINEFMLRGDGVHPEGRWPAKIPTNSLMIMAGASVYGGQSVSNILGFGLPSARGPKPQSGWYFQLNPATGVYSLTPTDALTADIVTGAPIFAVAGTVQAYADAKIPAAANPNAGGTYATSTLWANSGDSNRFYQGANKIAWYSDIPSLAGYVPTTRTITAGTGLTGGGDLSADRTLALAFNGLTAAAIDGANDYFAFWDASAATHKKILVDDFIAMLPSGGGDVAAAVNFANDNRLNRTDTATGVKNIQQSVVTLDDAGAMYGGTSLGLSLDLYSTVATGNKLNLQAGTVDPFEVDIVVNSQIITKFIMSVAGGYRQAQFANGLAGVPSIANQTATTTGIRFPGGADELVILAATDDVASFTSGLVAITGDLTTTGNISGVDATFTGKLTVSGVIDPTGLCITNGAARPAGVTTFGTGLWQNNASPNRLMFWDGTTDREILNSSDIGVTVQGHDIELAALAGLTSAADKLPYFTGSGTAALATFTAAGRALVDDADASAQRTTLGLAIGTNVQAWDADLDAIAALGATAGFMVKTGAGTFAVRTLTASTSLGEEGIYIGGGTGAAGNPTIGIYLPFLTGLTAPAVDDTLLIYDLSATQNKYITTVDLLETVNVLTEDTAPISSTDFLLSYDASASTVKKVKPASLVTDTLGAPTDVTTNNATTTAHGFLKKLSNVATEYMDGTGAWSVPAGSGGFTAASTTEVLTGTNTTKGVTPDALAALWEQGSNIASAGTISVGEGGYFFITGTTGITDIDFATDKAGRKVTLEFAGAVTITHNATTLILPGGANITTAAGDVLEFVSEGSDAVRCTNYSPAAGLQTLDADLTALAALASTAGMLSRTGAGAFAVRTLAADANNNALGISVTNGDGASGAPTIGLALTGLTTMTDPAGNDLLILYDTSATTNKKVSEHDLLAFGRVTNNTDITSTSTTLADTALSVTVEAGKCYVFEAYLVVKQSTASTGIKIDFDGSATMTRFAASCLNFKDSGNTNVLNECTDNTSEATDIVFTMGTDLDPFLIKITGSFVVNAGGTFLIRFARNSAGGTATLQDGSWLEVKPAQSV